LENLLQRRLTHRILVNAVGLLYFFDHAENLPNGLVLFVDAQAHEVSILFKQLKTAEHFADALDSIMVHPLHEQLFSKDNS